MPKRYVLNIKTLKIHDTQNATKRCKLSMMKKENQQFYDTLEDALAYPNAESPKSSKCAFCIIANEGQGG